MSFLNIATPFIDLGIPVFPLTPGSKVPPAGFRFLEEATIDPLTVAAWDRDNSEYNVALLANGDFCFLEFDVKGGLNAAAQEMGQEIPDTRYQKSGKGFGHCIFKHTERSRAIGNRSVNQPDGHEWFSFRAHNKYLVGSGSLHPNGTYYKTIRDVAPIPIPDWLCDFIEKHSTPDKPKAGNDGAQVCDDFDFEALMEHFDISGSWDGEWFITDECPVSGTRHSQSTRTGFFYDGNSLGFHCFAQGCEGSAMTVGQVIGYLNAKTGNRYKGPIWEKNEDELIGVDDLDSIIPDDFEFVAEPVATVEQTVAPATETPVAQETSPPETDDDPEPEPDEEHQTNVDPNWKLAAFKETGEDTSIGLIVQNAATFEMTELQWLWPERIPKGKVVLFTGKPDCGKSVVLLDLIARISNGNNFPDDSRNEHGASKVLLAASEDDPKDTLMPRLKAAGANMANVEIVVGTMLVSKDKKRGMKKRKVNLNLKRDAQMLLDAIKTQPDLKLLALDPITSFFGDADQNKDKDIRPIMDEITRVCNKSNIALVGIVHSNKRSDVDAVHKVSGAGSLAAAVRAVWSFSRDAEDKTLYHMSHVKGNLSKVKTGLNYTIEEARVDIQGKSCGIPRIVWGGVCAADADDLLAASREQRNKSDYKSAIAKAYLRTTVKFPIKAKVLYDQAKHDEGLSSDALKRAKTALWDEEFYIISKKQHDGWYWYHEQDGKLVKDTQATVEDVGGYDG